MCIRARGQPLRLSFPVLQAHFVQSKRQQINRTSSPGSPIPQDISHPNCCQMRHGWSSPIQVWLTEPRFTRDCSHTLAPFPSPVAGKHKLNLYLFVLTGHLQIASSTRPFDGFLLYLALGMSLRCATMRAELLWAHHAEKHVTSSPECSHRRGLCINTAATVVDFVGRD